MGRKLIVFSKRKCNVNIHSLYNTYRKFYCWCLIRLSEILYIKKVGRLQCRHTKFVWWHMYTSQPVVAHVYISGQASQFITMANSPCIQKYLSSTNKAFELPMQLVAY